MELGDPQQVHLLGSVETEFDEWMIDDAYIDGEARNYVTREGIGYSTTQLKGGWCSGLGIYDIDGCCSVRKQVRSPVMSSISST